MPIERDVRFLNIDLLLVGRFDPEPLVAAMGRDMFVLHEDAVFENRKCLALEVAAPDQDLSRTLARLLEWVEGLPPAARRSWAAASRRVFDIGIQAGRKPHDAHWTIRQEHISRLAKAGADVVLTVYGAEWKRRTAAARRPRPLPPLTPRSRTPGPGTTPRR